MHTPKNRLTQLAMASALAGILSITMTSYAQSADSSTPAVASTSVGTVIDDTVLTTRIRAALAADPQINSYDFKVETRKGVVMLSGFVDNQAQLDLALRTTRGIQGVQSIQNSVALKGADASVGNKVDDGIITGRIKAALLADPSVKSMDIRVLTRLDTVQLSGFVDNQQQIEKALAIASAVPGVRSVDNAMQIKN